jgi:hypothetical protein
VIRRGNGLAATTPDKARQRRKKPEHAGQKRRNENGAMKTPAEIGAMTTALRRSRDKYGAMNTAR